LALATPYQVVGVLVLFGYQGQVFAQADEQLVLIHPVVEEAELVNDFVLQFVDVHRFNDFYLGASPIGVAPFQAPYRSVLRTRLLRRRPSRQLARFQSGSRRNGKCKGVKV
jgi:hypothetical protein